MQISDKGLDLIKRFEGLRLDAYRCPAGIWTIGYGHTGSGVREGLTITPLKAETFLRADVGRFGEGVEECAGPCTQGQFDALVSFAFNLGLGALRASTLLKLHQLGQHKLAAAEFARWVYAGGKELPGLVRRRAAEAALYLEDRQCSHI
jgi:lysozyme